MTEPVIIEDYDPRWPEYFELLRRKIAPALSGFAAAIEHVGSTAVPGLAAKPIIDLDVLLRPDARLADVVARLAALGYEHRGDLGITGRDAFRAPDGAIRHHLYVCPSNSEEYRRHIAFRDFLRTHSERAGAYATLKRQLAQKFGSDREGYNQAKTDFVRETLWRADGEPSGTLKTRLHIGHDGAAF